MKFLLTSSGITNDSIRRALEELLGKRIADCTAICIPTAIYALPGGPLDAWSLLQAFELGWKRYGMLELTALPSLPEDCWLPDVERADAIIVGGGNTGYLSYWLHASGLAERLSHLLQNKVYVGMSAGSMMVTHSLNVNRERLDQTGVYWDDEYDEAAPSGAGSDKTLKLVDFVIRPHLNADYFPAVTLENAERWAVKAGVPLYAFDDQTALKVVNGGVEIVSEGTWKRFGTGGEASENERGG